MYKGERFNRESTLDVQTHYKRTETFQYTNFYSCHDPPGVKKGFIKGEALCLLRTNLSVLTFNNNMQSFRTRLKNRGYPNKFSEKILSEVNLRIERGHLKIKATAHKRKYCLLLHNTIRLYLTSRTYLWGNGTLFKTNRTLENYLRSHPYYHIAKKSR